MQACKCWPKKEDQSSQEHGEDRPTTTTGEHSDYSKDDDSDSGSVTEQSTTESQW